MVFVNFFNTQFVLTQLWASSWWLNCALCHMKCGVEFLKVFMGTRGQDPGFLRATQASQTLIPKHQVPRIILFIIILFIIYSLIMKNKVIKLAF